MIGLASAEANASKQQRLVSTRVWALAGAFVLTAAVIALVISELTPPIGDEPELSAYDQQAIAILDQQSAINGDWNSLLDELNVQIVGTDDDYVEHFNARLAKARSIVNDSQAIIVRWRKLDPPVGSDGSHSLALEAMESTQYGFIAMQEYLEQAASLGISDASLIEESQSHIDDASKLWEQARQADVGS